ncbi:huntingtin-interacting protein 1-like [Colletes gigas]|uniref:huntingtin-interacting protein 1-like n=1 Tax=Colletes gigas TaxID=935657 RepID=UPI001C9B8BAE|nr:huntingtin-interacting protein 1-like [Colletes gigas]
MISVSASLKNTPSNCMTVSGQCRPAPLIPCVPDASQLYDYCVKILLKLDNTLPADTLAGHRDRFSKQFYEPKKLYNTVKQRQYFKHVITTPALPENPPNFLIQSELRTYATPRVVSPPEESLAERESPIDHLQQENSHQRQESHRLPMDHQRITEELQSRVMQLESGLLINGNEIEQEKQVNQDSLKQKADTMAKVDESEEKYLFCFGREISEIERCICKMKRKNISV